MKALSFKAPTSRPARRKLAYPLAMRQGSVRVVLLFARSPPGGFSHHQLRRDDDFLLSLGGGFLGGKAGEDLTADLVPGNMQSSQRRIDNLRKGDVIGTRHGNLSRNINSHVSQLPQDPHRHEIVHAKDRRGTKFRSEELLYGPASACVIVRIGNRFELNLRRIALHDLDERAFAIAERSQCRVVADEINLLMPEAPEILRYALDAPAVVRFNAEDAASRRAYVVHHGSYLAFFQLVENGRIDLGNHQCQSRHAAAQHDPHARIQPLRIVIGISDEHLVAVCVRLLFQHAENIEEEGIFEVRNDQAKRSAYPARKRPGMHVGVIFQFLDRLQHTCACAAFDDTDVVQNTGNGGGRNTRTSGYIFQAHPVRPSELFERANLILPEDRKSTRLNSSHM